MSHHVHYTNGTWGWPITDPILHDPQSSKCGEWDDTGRGSCGWTLHYTAHQAWQLVSLSLAACIIVLLIGATCFLVYAAGRGQ